jgi:hypothetical protein
MTFINKKVDAFPCGQTALLVALLDALFATTHFRHFPQFFNTLSSQLIGTRQDSNRKRRIEDSHHIKISLWKVKPHTSANNPEGYI